MFKLIAYQYQDIDDIANFVVDSDNEANEGIRVLNHLNIHKPLGGNLISAIKY